MKPVPGRWYMFATCRSCHREFAIWEDPTQGKGDISVTGTQEELVCDHCGHRTRVDQIRRGQAPQVH